MLDRKILDDKTKYPDTFVIDLGDGVKATLGDVREFYAVQEAELGKFSTRNQFVEGEYAKLVDQYNGLAANLEQMRQQMDAAKNQPQNVNVVDELVKRLTTNGQPNVFDKPGEYFKPVVERMAALAEQIKAIETKNTAFQESLRKELTGAFGFQASKDLKRDFRSYDWPKDWTFDKVMMYAKQSNLLEPGSGYPDFDRIHETITGPTRYAKEREDMIATAKAEGRKEAEDEFRKNGGTFVPGPGFGGAGVTGANNGKTFGGIDKIPDETILNDPDIWTQNIQ